MGTDARRTSGHYEVFGVTGIATADRKEFPFYFRRGARRVRRCKGKSVSAPAKYRQNHFNPPLKFQTVFKKVASNRKKALESKRKSFIV
jgi:hypothetical protein